MCLCMYCLCLQLMWPDVWTEPWLWAVDSSPVWKTQPVTRTGCTKSVNSSSTQLLPSTPRWVRHSVHLSIHLSVRLSHLCVFVVFYRVKLLWRKVCSASPRESQQRSSKPSAAATSSRGWSQRFVNSRRDSRSADNTPLCSLLTRFLSC